MSSIDTTPAAGQSLVTRYTNLIGVASVYPVPDATDWDVLRLDFRSLAAGVASIDLATESNTAQLDVEPSTLTQIAFIYVKTGDYWRADCCVEGVAVIRHDGTTGYNSVLIPNVPYKANTDANLAANPPVLPDSWPADGAVVCIQTGTGDFATDSIDLQTQSGTSVTTLDTNDARYCVQWDGANNQWRPLAVENIPAPGITLPNNATIATTGNQFVMETVDNANTWTDTGYPVVEPQAYGVDFDPENGDPNSGWWLIGANNGKLFVYDANAGTFTEITTPAATTSNVWQPRISYTTTTTAPRRLYIADDDGIHYVDFPVGQDPTAIVQGDWTEMTIDDGGGAVGSVAFGGSYFGLDINRGTGALTYASVNNGGTRCGFSDDGATWTAVNPPNLTRGQAVANGIAFGRDGAAGCGDDPRANATVIFTGDRIRDAYYNPDTGLMLVGCENGTGQSVYRSTDAGGTWAVATTPPPFDVLAIGQMPNGDVIALGTGGAQWRSTDLGDNFVDDAPNTGPQAGNFANDFATNGFPT